MTEHDIQTSILDYLRYAGYWAIRVNSGRAGRIKLGDAGSPDIMGCGPGGRLLAIEVKGADGRLRPAQERVLSLLRDRGAIVVVARSVEDVEAALNRARGLDASRR